MKNKFYKKIAGFCLTLSALAFSLPAHAATITANQLSMPSIGVTAPIVVSDTISSIGKYPWLRTPKRDPATSKMVFAGHRTHLLMKAAFTDLPKMKKGDSIIMTLDGKRYEYVVRETKIVPPTAVDIEFNTATPQIVLFTCFYSTNAKNRFAVFGDLKSIN